MALCIIAIKSESLPESSIMWKCVGSGSVNFYLIHPFLDLVSAWCSNWQTGWLHRKVGGRKKGGREGGKKEEGRRRREEREGERREREEEWKRGRLQ